MFKYDMVEIIYEYVKKTDLHIERITSVYYASQRSQMRSYSL